MSLQTLISINEVSKFYQNGFEALNKINLKINKGEIIALLGPNGAGKTTLINIICGIVTASAGNVEIGGFDNVSFNQNGKVMKLLTRLSLENLLHPFQTFILGQKNLAPKLAANLGINLVFYGENEAEYGNPIADNTFSLIIRFQK